MKKNILVAIAITGLIGLNNISSVQASEDSARFLAKKGIIVNHVNTKDFELEKNILRQEIATLTLKLANLEKNETCKNFFSDVSDTKPNSWVCTAVEALYTNGMIAKNKNFYPEKNITKAEAVGMIVKSLYKNEYVFEKKKGDWQKQIVDFAVSKKLIQNFTDYQKAANRGFIFDLAKNAFENKNLENVVEKVYSKNPKTSQISTFVYSFPDGSYKGLQKKSEYQLPARFNGLISYPKNPGKYPLAFIIHGGSPDCIWKNHSPNFNHEELYTTQWEGVCPDSNEAWKNLPKGIKNPYNYYGPDYAHNYMGMAYLAEALAKNGIIAVSVDSNIQSNAWLKKGYSNGLDNAVAVVQKHFQLLKDINNGKNHGLQISDIEGKIDFENISIIGHSNGGVAAYYIATEEKIPNVQSLVLLEAGGFETEPDVAKKKVDTLLVRGSCDEQLGADTGLYLLEELQKKGKGKAFLLDALIQGAGHGEINTFWAGNECEGKPERLSREKTQEAVVSLTTSFLKNLIENKEMILKIPKDVGVQTKTFEGKKGEDKIVEKTDYTYISPKTIKRIFSKEKILDDMPPKEVIGKGE